MVDTELEAKIRKVVEDTYCCKATFPIKAKIVDNTYMVYFYLNNSRIDPLHIIKEDGTEQEFLDWLKDDLLKRNLLRSSYIKINLEQ